MINSFRLKLNNVKYCCMSFSVLFKGHITKFSPILTQCFNCSYYSILYSISPLVWFYRCYALWKYEGWVRWHLHHHQIYVLVTNALMKHRPEYQHMSCYQWPMALDLQYTGSSQKKWWINSSRCCQNREAQKAVIVSGFVRFR